MAEALVEAALEAVDPDVPFCVVGMGRLGGAEMSYASDLDVLFVYDGASDIEGETVAESLLHLMHGPSPAQRVATVDLGLRPEGGQGRLARDLAGYQAYFDRWAQTWERQALLRARVVAGDRALGERFLALVDDFVWDRPLTDDDVADIRRMKARIERERIPRRGPAVPPEARPRVAVGHRVDGTAAAASPPRSRHGTDRRAQALGSRRVSADRRHSVTPTGSSNAPGTAGTWWAPRWHAPGTPCRPARQRPIWPAASAPPGALRDEYRRVTRRARRVVERVDGLDDA